MSSCTTREPKQEPQELWVPNHKNQEVFNHFNIEPIKCSDPKFDELVCLSHWDFVKYCTGPR